jgi:coproporphyrinogen III oxidase-like Fe-S oxidoreductase
MPSGLRILISKWIGYAAVLVIVHQRQASGFPVAIVSRSLHVPSRQGCSLWQVDFHQQDTGKEEETHYGLYIHIPYCRRRCRYCSFAIVPIGSTVDPDASTSSSMDAATRGFLAMDESYRASLLQEIQSLQKRHSAETSSTSKPPFRLKSLYFGGGTPSLAPLETIQAIWAALFTTPKCDNYSLQEQVQEPLFQLNPTAEVTMEMDPGTFSVDKLQGLKDMGFNRISLGVQSFDDTVLEAIGRVHRRSHVMEAIAMIDTVFGGGNNPEGKINYSIDLISGLPGLSLALWADTLATAVSLQPPPSHISLYDLQIEQGTVFGQWYNNNESKNDEEKLLSKRTRASSLTLATTIVSSSSSSTRAELPSEEDCAFMYKYAAGYLRAKGFEHYEISSYAKLGTHGAQPLTNPRSDHNRSQHNQIYWDVDGQWFALGLGATSFVNGIMIARPRTLTDYQQWIQRQSTNKRSAEVDDNSHLPKTMHPREFLTDVIMKRLRTTDGLDLDWVKKYHGQECLDAVMRGAALGLDLGLMTVVEDKEEHSKSLRLNDPDGFLYSNNLISSIFVALGGGYDAVDAS